MYDRILLPTDGSEGASIARNHAFDVAAAHGATVHVLNVADTTRDSVLRVQGNVLDVLEGEGERIVEEAAEGASGRGVETVTEVLRGEPHSTIVDYADDREIDLVVMPTRGRRGLERLLLGSTAERVVRHATTPVLTIRPDDAVDVTYPYESVLVPTDGSDGAGAALDLGIDEADANGAALHLLSVIDIAGLGVDARIDVRMAALEESAEEVLEDAAARAREAGIESVSETVETGTPIHERIRAYVEDHGVDLVVVGTHGATGLDRYLLGSVTEKLIRTSPVPVLTVRESADD